MRSRFLSVLTLALATALYAQDAAKQNAVTQPMGQRDKFQEDAVAKLFPHLCKTGGWGGLPLTSNRSE
jgi:hypothetical protein